VQEALDEKLAELFVLFTEGEMSEVSTTTIRMLSEDIPHAPLVRYLNLIARADQIWDISYDYTRIRGMVWMAIEGLAEAAKSHPILSDGLVWFAHGYLAYTACEGGFISNDLPRLAHHARQAHASFSKARDALEPLEHEAAEALREDIEGRLAYFDGLALYAETLEALLDGTLEDGQLAGVLEVLDGFLVAVEAYDPELSSELRAHRLFLEQHGEHTASAPPLLLDAEVVLGVCAYVDDDLMKRLNHDILNDPDFGEPALSEWLSVSLQGALRTEALQDIFETALGEENMHASVFQLGEMRLVHRGKPYEVTPTLKFSNLGIIALEFALTLEEADEFELQSIVDLIAPYAPEVLLVHGEHDELEPPDIRHPFSLIEQLAAIEPDSALLAQARAIILSHADALARDMNINRDLSDCLEALAPVLAALREQAETDPALAPLRTMLIVHQAGSDYFRSLCDHWMAGFLAGCHKRYGLERFKISYDSERDWFSTVKFSSLHSPDGPRRTCPELVNEPRFRWMLCPVREAKASIGDWILADDSLPTNLATIRSHRTDFLFIRGNQAWFYFPDDPYYLIDYEYTETLRLMMWIRTLVNAFTELAIAYNKRSDELRRAFLRLGAHPHLRELLRDERRLAEYFKLKADNKLSLLQDCRISRYEDHARLIDAVVTHMDLDRGRALLASRLDKVIATQAFLDRQVEALSAQAREEREIRRVRLSAQNSRFLKSITTIAAGLYGTVLIPFTEEWQRYALIAAIIGPISVLLVRNWLEQRSARIDMNAQDDAFREKLSTVREELGRGLEWSP
jgi:hypothetical protein